MITIEDMEKAYQCFEEMAEYEDGTDLEFTLPDGSQQCFKTGAHVLKKKIEELKLREYGDRIVFQKAVIVSGLANSLQKAIEDLIYFLNDNPEIEYYSPDFLYNRNTEKILEFGDCGNLESLLKFIQGETEE